jgi:hypothetical protein
MTHDVFISYSSKDKPIADGICARMEADGLRCWIAPRDIGSGEDWPTAIANGIAGSKVMVLVFSQNSNVSEDVSRELYLAANNKVVIIPFVIENVKPEAGKAYYLGRTHWLDAMNPPTDEQIGRLIERVHSLMEPAGNAGGVARVLDFGQRVHRKRPWAIPAALILVAALVIGGISFIPKIMTTFFPVGLSPSASVDPSFYLHREDFNDPEFNGGLPPEWGPGPCPDITLAQENGSLVFQTQADVLPSCSIGPGSWYTMSQVKALEFAISNSPEMQVAPASFAFFMNGASEPGQNGRLALNCGLNGSQSGCVVSTEQGPLYQTRSFTVIPGESYVFRIEILDPDQMAFRFVLNSETIGEFTMSPADIPLYKDLSFHVAGGVVQMGGKAKVGAYYLDYLAIEQR